MSTSPLYAAIPASHRAAVERAVHETFGGAEPQALTPMEAGLSGAAVFKLTVAERAYVLRLILVRTPVSDPSRQFTCQSLASARGLTPQLHCADAEAGLSLSDHIASQPLRPALLAEPGRVSQLGGLLRHLHAGPAFPPFLDVFQLVDGGRALLAGANFPLPEPARDALEQFSVLRELLRPHLLSVPCHNDLNPNNVLFDGDRLWLIDWETACMGDPFLDLATASHWFLFTPEQEESFLRAYFGRVPDARQRAKLELMRQVSSSFYATVFLLLLLQEGHTAPPHLPEHVPLPRFADALRAVGEGRMNLREPATRYGFSLLLFRESLQAMERPEATRALELLRP